MNLPITTLPISSVTVDDRLQPRCDGLSEDHLAALMETAEDWPPIIVAHIDGWTVLRDGFHRVEAATRLGYESIGAQVFYPEHGADLFATAFALNVKHGRPLTLRDRKTYAVALLQRHPELTDRECGRRTGLHHETVGALREHQTRARIVDRKPGELRDDIGVLDPIRFGNKASKEQKAVAGYIQRLGEALHDPYSDNSTLNVWPENPAAITRACFAAMGDDRATKLLTMLEADAHFILQVSKARTTIPKEEST